MKLKLTAYAMAVVAAVLAPRQPLPLRWRRDRGDVPGWVLITVMTAGLVSALWIFAGPALVDLFKQALASATKK